MSALLPIAIDLARLRVALVGNGARAERRLRLLDETGALRVRVYSDAPEQDLSARAGDRLRRRLPSYDDLLQADIVFIAGLPESRATALAELACGARVLVNVEDKTEECDFHSAAVVRRGDLAVGIWTGGRCPLLARVMKQWLERLLPADFGKVVDRLAETRDRLRAAGSGFLSLELAAKLAVARLGGRNAPARSAAKTQHE